MPEGASVPPPAPSESPVPENAPAPVVEVPAPELAIEVPIQEVLPPTPDPVPPPTPTHDVKPREVAPIVSPAAIAPTIPVVDDAARARALARRVERREGRLQKIVEIAKKHGFVSNRDIVLRLHISHATTSRYVRTLVARGALAAEGKGRGRKYRTV